MSEQHIKKKLEPYAAQLALLDEIPGIDWTLAAVIIAELGVDMSVFQSVSQGPPGREFVQATMNRPVSARVAASPKATCTCRRP
jgi:transposase